MNPNGTPYTPNTGLTPQGSQLNQTASMMQNLASGQPLNPQQTQAANQGATAAASQLGQMGTPGARQSYMNNGDLPAMQSNYEDLARKLFSVDQQIAASGQYNPTPAPDATAGQGVAASPLELTPNILGASSFNPINPAVGMNTQITGQNNVVDLLNTLNSSIGKEFNSRKGTYASTVQGQRDVLDAYLKVLGMSSDLADKIASRKSISGSSVAGQKLQVDQDLTKFLKGVIGGDGKVSPSDYLKAKQYAVANGMTAVQFDQDYRNYRNPKNSSYNVEPGSLTTDERKNLQAQEDADKSGQSLVGTLDSILGTYKSLNPFEKRIPISLASQIPFLSPQLAAMNTKFFTGIEGDLRKSIIGGRITQQEIKWFRDAILPTPGDTDQSYETRVNAAKQELTKKLGNPDYVIGNQSAGTIRVRNKQTGQTGTLPTNNFDPNKYDKI